jgi:hypothetical protein
MLRGRAAFPISVAMHSEVTRRSPVSYNQDCDVVGLGRACGKSLHAIANRSRKLFHSFSLELLHDLPQVRFFK